MNYESYKILKSVDFKTISGITAQKGRPYTSDYVRLVLRGNLKATRFTQIIFDEADVLVKEKINSFNLDGKTS